jgi:hypothetical protein
VFEALANQENWVVDTPFLSRVLDQGFIKGCKAGEINILKRQLTYKFGKLPNWVEMQLKTAKSEQLLSWSLSLLNAQCLEEVFL